MSISNKHKKALVQNGISARKVARDLRRERNGLSSSSGKKESGKKG